MPTTTKRKRPARKAKSKLTLSVEPKYVAMLRRAGARRGRSITELVQEYAVQLDKETGAPEELSDYVKRNLGALAGKIKPEDWDRNDRVGHMLRKHMPR
ncbi:MAG: hypothetical protein IPL52_07140 [Flavobacteriales bacterium]|nr:hypothetical protein [Flavobacteriales bacterium]